MRIIFSLLALMLCLFPKAQTHLPVNNMYMQWSPYNYYHPIPDSSQLSSKWYFSKYAGVSAGFGFFNGGSSTFIAAPVGLQINHPLNNNLVAFAGISAAPAFFSVNHSFADPLIYKSYPGYNTSNAYGLGINSRVEIGLMYINDAKTFSISGSIGIERESYPAYPTDGINTRKQSAFR